jgi:hypothetical protein
VVPQVYYTYTGIGARLGGSEEGIAVIGAVRTVGEEGGPATIAARLYGLEPFIYRDIYIIIILSSYIYSL